jgi:PAS domain-containing protein
MSKNDELGGVIGSLYDAAMNPELWPDALAKVAAFVGGPAVALSPKELMGKFDDTGDRVGLDFQYMETHSQASGEFDRLPAEPRFDVGQTVDLPDLVPSDDRRSAWPGEWGNAANAVVEKPEKTKFCDVLRDDANGAGEEMRRRMTLVAPHVRRAVLIGKAIDRKADQAAILANILDSLSAGLFLIEADGRITLANAAGREILDADDFLRSINGRLVARGAKADQVLRGSLADKGGDVGNKDVTLPLTARDGEHYVAHVLPLDARTRPGNETRGTVAAVFVCKAALETSSSVEVIRLAYQLTRTELRVLLAIVNVGGIPDVATALGVADCTIKTHVRRLFQKTGTGRQADLVKLVAGFFTPLVA